MRKTALLIAFLMSFAGMAFAIPCNQGGVSGSSACLDGFANNDFPAPATVNSESLFGYSDWTYLQKYENPPETNLDYGFTVTGFPSTNGTWAFNSSVWDDFSDVMIVLKSGRHNTIDDRPPIFFSAYLLDDTLKAIMGTWDTGQKDISHLTLYARGEGDGGGDDPPPPVPEPSTFLLLAAGLAFGIGIRRKIR